MSKDYTFNPGDFVVYPAHGVGQITNIEQTEVAGQKLDLIAVNFNKDKLTLRIPMPNAQKSGLRQVVTSETMGQAIHTLKGKAKVKRTQWGKRSQEYMSKINSGDPIAVAEVLRDLYKDPEKAEQTYSERQIYEQAMARLVAEYAVVKNIKEDQAISNLEEVLKTKDASLA